MWKLRLLLCAVLVSIFPMQAASASVTLYNPAGRMEDGTYVDSIINNAAHRETIFPRTEKEVLDVKGDALEEFNSIFLQRGWGDGLPMVPPTPERVEAMMAGYDLPADFPVATLPPIDGVATVEKIAVNAVMAGCEPRHMPLLVAAVEAVGNPDFDLRGMATTTNPDSVLMIVSGPIVKKLKMNAGTGSFGRGNRANACISRALHLIIQNIGGSRQGITDMSTMGQPGEFVMCLGENAEASPWPSFQTERGFLPERNVVTVASVEGYSSIMGIGYTRTEYLDLIASWMRGHDRAFRQDIILLVAQDTAAMLAREGWSRKKMREYLANKAKTSYGEWWSQFHGSREARQHVPGYVAEIVDSKQMIPRPFIGELSIIVSGGTGEKSMILPCWANGRSVSQEIRLPADWK